MEHCTVRDAALKLVKWFKVGESKLASPTGGEEKVTDARVDSLIKLVLQSVIEEIEGEIAQLTQQLELKQHRLAELQEVIRV